jgi:hypothetical protein
MSHLNHNKYKQNCHLCKYTLVDKTMAFYLSRIMDIAVHILFSTKFDIEAWYFGLYYFIILQVMGWPRTERRCLLMPHVTVLSYRLWCDHGRRDNVYQCVHVHKQLQTFTSAHCVWCSCSQGTFQEGHDQLYITALLYSTIAFHGWLGAFQGWLMLTRAFHGWLGLYNGDFGFPRILTDV